MRNLASKSRISSSSSISKMCLFIKGILWGRAGRSFEAASPLGLRGLRRGLHRHDTAHHLVPVPQRDHGEANRSVPAALIFNDRWLVPQIAPLLQRLKDGI